jgi:apolipoprotein D and lipocalin family protein
MLASTAWPVLAATILTVTASAALPSQGRPSPVRVAESIDFARYAGSWFEVARLPNALQGKCAADVTAHYARRSDGRIDVINRCRTAAGAVVDVHGIGRRLAQGATDARWQVRYASGVRAMFGGGWTEYWILGIGPDYTWAVAGSPTRDRLWILSRTPEMSAASYERALAVARGNGFDVNRLIETKHSSR